MFRVLSWFQGLVLFCLALEMSSRFWVRGAGFRVLDLPRTSKTPELRNIH